MKKSFIIIGIIAVVAIILYSSIKGTYNSMVAKDEAVTAAWAQVQNAYQRRADLIPNLVNTVRGYATHERETLEGVIEARAKATATNINLSDPQSMQQYQQSQDQLSSALSRLMVVVEQYPDLKANQNFLDLQAQLEGTENRISVERQRFNQAAQEFNTFIRSFPRNIYASIFNFQTKAYFQAQAGAERAPEVQF